MGLVRTFITDCLSVLIHGGNKYDKRDDTGIMWRLTDLIGQELHLQFTKQDRKAILSEKRFLTDGIIEATYEDCLKAKMYESIMLEEDSWNEEAHEYNRKKKFVTTPIGGQHLLTMAYRLSFNPSVLMVHCVMQFSEGTYTLIEPAQDGFEEAVPLPL